MTSKLLSPSRTKIGASSFKMFRTSTYDTVSYYAIIPTLDQNLALLQVCTFRRLFGSVVLKA